uniref:Uncharacterized protein n=1 Tax=Ovis aries TaxID=9940 RepID=A0AC11DN23_SHEEP
VGEGDTHHFESICLDVEVWVVLVALDHAGLDPTSRTLDEDLGTIHREELHLLHFSDSPEENLRRKRIPWRRSWQPTAAFLPGESHGQRSLVG